MLFSKLVNPIAARLRVLGVREMDSEVRAFLLTPGFLRKKRWIDFFVRDTFIEHLDEKNKTAVVQGIKFSYKGISTKDFVREVVSIMFGNNSYVQRNFSDPHFFNIEGPYEHGPVMVESGDVVIDAGANMGVFSLYAARQCRPHGHVYAFEPITQTRTMLDYNVHQNDTTEQVSIVPLALGAQTGERTFVVNARHLGSSSGVLNAAGEKHVVRQTSLDVFVQTRAIQKVSFIKADIEGMERELLDGATETIGRCKPKIALCTYHHADDPQELEKRIKDIVPEYVVVHSEKKLYAHVA